MDIDTLIAREQAIHDAYRAANEDQHDLATKTSRDLNEARRLYARGDGDRAWYEARSSAIKAYHAVKTAQIEDELKTRLEALK